MAITAILGAGVMGETILAGLLRAGRPAAELVVAERRPERAQELEERYAVRVLTNLAAAETATTLVLAVKPQDLGALLTEIAPVVTQGDLVVSLAAGLSAAFIEARLPAGVAVVRVMPNTPALVDQGMAAICRGTTCTDAQLDEAQALVSSTGRVVRIDEVQMDAVTAVSGSGPAYLFLVAEAMIAAGVDLGLPQDVVSELVVQTLVGSAAMLRETGTEPAELRRQVTSPGGTTAAAIAQLEAKGLRAAFLAAMTAARDRSIELGAGS